MHSSPPNIIQTIMLDAHSKSVYMYMYSTAAAAASNKSRNQGGCREGPSACSSRFSDPPQLASGLALSRPRWQQPQRHPCRLGARARPVPLSIKHRAHPAQNHNFRNFYGIFGTFFGNFVVYHPNISLVAWRLKLAKLELTLGFGKSGCCDCK